MDRREGYGRAASGGLDGTLVTVTSPEDDGPGTLREALRGAHAPTWIDFSGDMVLELRSQLRIPSNVTIDGRGHTIVLHDYGFGIYNAATNVILTHLTIDGQFKTASQAVNVSGDVHDVWLDHLDLSRFIDRLVNVKRGSTDVTISWTKFHDHNKVMLLNNEIGEDLFANVARDAGTRVTIHHSYFVNTVQRNPRAQYGTYQIYNNLLENWDFYGMSFSLEAKALVAGNIFVNDPTRSCVEPALFETVEGVTRNYCRRIPVAPERAILPNGAADEGRYKATDQKYHYGHDYRAFIALRDNLFLGASTSTDSYKPELAPSLPKCSTYRSPDAALAAQIRQSAGNGPMQPDAVPTCQP